MAGTLGPEAIFTSLKGTILRFVNSVVALHVAIVDGSGNQVTSFGGSGGTSATDESTFTVGSGSGTPAMGLYEASPTSVSDGQVGALGMTADRKLKVSGSLTTTPAAAGTPTLGNVASSATSVTLLSANASRLSFVIYNDSTQAANVKFGATASTSSFTKRLMPYEEWSTTDVGVNYTGRIDAIWDSANGNMRVTELAA